eukprot:Pgem_evm2s2380
MNTKLIFCCLVAATTCNAENKLNTAVLEDIKAFHSNKETLLNNLDNLLSSQLLINNNNNNNNYIMFLFNI